MKTFLLFILFILFVRAANAQYNFVPNGSFEQYSSLPDDLGEMYRSLDWTSAVTDTMKGLSDYYNLQANFFGNMPNTIFSGILPEDGSGAAGFYVYDTIHGYREFISCRFLLPLHPNLDYRVSFYLSIGANYKNTYVCNNVGLGFTTDPLYQSQTSGLTFSPQLETVTVPEDSLWHRYVFHFVPKSRYQYLTIGNFRSNPASDVVRFGSGMINGGYIFIDSINVIPKFYAFRDTTICRGDSVRLFAIGDNLFSWIDKSNPAAVLSTDSFVVVHPVQTTSYIVHGTGANVDTVTVRVDVPPQINLGFDTVLCDNNHILIGDTCVDCTYAWNTGTISSYISIGQKGNYVLAGTNACGTAKDSIYVSQVVKPAIPLKDEVFCASDSVLLNAFHPGATYLWSNSATASSITVNQAGIYTVTLNDSTCKYQYSASVHSFPKPQLFIGDDTSLCSGNTLQLTAEGSYQSLIWSTGSAENTIEISSGGKYFATATNSCGSISDSVDVKFEDCPTIRIPNAFSPNGDGLNDRLILEYPSLKSFDLRIFDRWGQLIFSTTNPGNFWDGTHNGSQVPIGSYAYVINARSAEGLQIHETGMITLIR